MYIYIYIFSLPDSSYNCKKQANLSFINYTQHSGTYIHYELCYKVLLQNFLT